MPKSIVDQTLQTRDEASLYITKNEKSHPTVQDFFAVLVDANIPIYDPNVTQTLDLNKTHIMLPITVNSMLTKEELTKKFSLHFEGINSLAKNNCNAKIFIPILNGKNWCLIEVSIVAGGVTRFYSPTIEFTFWEPFGREKGISKTNFFIVQNINQILKQKNFNILSITFDVLNDIHDKYNSMDYCLQKIMQESKIKHTINEAKDPENLRKEILKAINQTHIRTEQQQEKEAVKQEKIKQVFRQWVINAIKKDGISVKFAESLIKEKFPKELETYIKEQLNNFVQQKSNVQDLHETLLLLLKGLLQEGNLHPDVHWTISKISESSKTVQDIFFVVLAKACIDGLIIHINPLLNSEIKESAKSEYTSQIYSAINDAFLWLRIDSYRLDNKRIDELLDDKTFQKWLLENRSTNINNLKQRNKSIKESIEKKNISENTYTHISDVVGSLIKYFEVKKNNMASILTVDEFRAWFSRVTKDIKFYVLDKSKYENLLVQLSDILISLAASSKDLLPYNLRTLLQDEYNIFVAELKKEYEDYIKIKKEHSNSTFEEYILAAKSSIKSIATQKFMKKLDDYTKNLFLSSEVNELNSSIQLALTGTDVKQKKLFLDAIVKDEKLDSIDIIFKHKAFIPMMLSTIEKTQESLPILSLLNSIKQQQYSSEQIVSAKVRFSKLMDCVNSEAFEKNVNDYQKKLSTAYTLSLLFANYFVSRINFHLKNLDEQFEIENSFKKVSEYEKQIVEAQEDIVYITDLTNFCTKEVQKFWLEINESLKKILNNLEQYKDNATFQKLSTDPIYKNLNEQIQNFTGLKNSKESTFNGFANFVTNIFETYQNKDRQVILYYASEKNKEVRKITELAQEIDKGLKKIHNETKEKKLPVADFISYLIELRNEKLDENESLGSLLFELKNKACDDDVSKLENRFIGLFDIYENILKTKATNGYVKSISGIKKIFSENFHDTQNELSEINTVSVTEEVSDDEELQSKSDSPEKELKEKKVSLMQMSFTERKSSFCSPKKKSISKPNMPETTTDKLDKVLFQGSNKNLPIPLIQALGGQKNLSELSIQYGDEGVQNLIRECCRGLLCKIAFTEYLDAIKDYPNIHELVKLATETYEIIIDDGKLLYLAAVQLSELKAILSNLENIEDIELKNKIVNWIKEINFRLEKAKTNSLTLVIKSTEIYDFLKKIMAEKKLLGEKSIQNWIVSIDSTVVEPLMRKLRNEVKNVTEKLWTNIELFNNDESELVFENFEVYAYLNWQIKQCVNDAVKISIKLKSTVNDIRANRKEKKSNYKNKECLEDILSDVKNLEIKHSQYVALFSKCNSTKEEDKNKQQEIWLDVCKKDDVIIKHLSVMHSLRNLLSSEHEFKNNKDYRAEKICQNWNEKSKLLVENICNLYGADLPDEKLFLELENEINAFLEQDKQARKLAALTFKLNDFANQWDKFKEEEKEEKLNEIENARNFLAEVNILAGNEDYKTYADKAVSICDFSKGVDGYNKIQEFFLKWTKSQKSIPENEIEVYLKIKEKLLKQKNLDERHKVHIITCDRFLLMKKVETTNSLVLSKLDSLSKKFSLKHEGLNKLNTFYSMSNELHKLLVQQHNGRHIAINENILKWTKMALDYEQGMSIYSKEEQLEHYKYLKENSDKIQNLLEKIEKSKFLDKKEKLVCFLDGPKKTSLDIIKKTKAVLDDFLNKQKEISKEEIEKFDVSYKLLLSQCTSSNEVYKYQKKSLLGLSSVLIDINDLKIKIQSTAIFSMQDVLPALKESTFNTKKKEISEYLRSFSSQTALQDMQKCLQGIPNLHDALNNVELILKNISIQDNNFQPLCVLKNALKEQLKNRVVIENDLISIDTPIDKIHVNLHRTLRALMNDLPPKSICKYNVAALKEKFLLIKDNYVQNKTDSHALVMFQYESIQLCDAVRLIIKKNSLDYPLALFANSSLTKDLELIKQAILDVGLTKGELLEKVTPEVIKEDGFVEIKGSRFK